MLSVTVFLPLLGALIVSFISPSEGKVIKYVAGAFAGLSLVFSLLCIGGFNPSDPAVQFRERVEWIPSLGIWYSMGLDGLSSALLLLSAFLSLVAVLSSWGPIKERVKEFYILMLVLETGLLGVFVARDLVLFYVFWELTLIPMYLLIGIWGHEERFYAAVKFLLFTFVGSVLMLVGFVVVAVKASSAMGVLSFDYDTVSSALALQRLSNHVQMWVFIAMALGFAIKVPVIPLHTWLPDAHTEAPTAGSVLLAGVLLKMGAYGFLRFCVPLLPDATRQFTPLMMTLAVGGIIYGGLCALAQRDFKRLVAYSSVSHMGLIMLGIFSLNMVAVQGAILQMVNHGLSTGGLFLAAGVLLERFHTRRLEAYGGLGAKMPVFAVVLLIISLSSLGLPGLNGFVGEVLVLGGAIRASFWLGAIAVTGVLLSALYLLKAYKETMHGEAKVESMPDLGKREVGIFAVLIALIVLIGVRPGTMLKLSERSVAELLSEGEKVVVMVGESLTERENQNKAGRTSRGENARNRGLVGERK